MNDEFVRRVNLNNRIANHEEAELHRATYEHLAALDDIHGTNNAQKYMDNVSAGMPLNKTMTGISTTAPTSTSTQSIWTPVESGGSSRPKNSAPSDVGHNSGAGGASPPTPPLSSGTGGGNLPPSPPPASTPPKKSKWLRYTVATAGAFIVAAVVSKCVDDAKEQALRENYPALSIAVGKKGGLYAGTGPDLARSDSAALATCNNKDDFGCAILTKKNPGKEICVGFEEKPGEHGAYFEYTFGVNSVASLVDQKKACLANPTPNCTAGYIRSFCNTQAAYSTILPKIGALNNDIAAVAEQKAAAEKKAREEKRAAEVQRAAAFNALLADGVATVSAATPLAVSPNSSRHSITVNKGDCVTLDTRRKDPAFARVTNVADGMQGWLPKDALAAAPSCRQMGATAPQIAAPRTTAPRTFPAPPPVQAPAAPSAGGGASTFNAYAVVASGDGKVLTGPSGASGIKAYIHPGDCVLIKGFDKASGFTEVAVRERSGVVSGWIGEFSIARNRSCDFNANAAPAGAPPVAAGPGNQSSEAYDRVARANGPSADNTLDTSKGYKTARSITIRANGRTERVSEGTCVKVLDAQSRRVMVMVDVNGTQAWIPTRSLAPAPECK